MTEMTDPDRIPVPARTVLRTRRLELTPFPSDVARAILAGNWPLIADILGSPFPDEWRRDGWSWLGHHLERAERHPFSPAWGPRLLLREEVIDDGTRVRKTVIGEAGFHGPPDDGWLEVGYMIVAEHRRQGFAEEALRALLRWASDQPDVAGFEASVDPGNLASRNLLRKLGFEEEGRYQHHIRGEELRCRKLS